MDENKIPPQWLANFITIYKSLNTENIHEICKIYHTNIIFEDPLHKVEGLVDLLNYFSNLYQNLSFCEFTINDYFYTDDKAAIYWTMLFKHEKLNGGNDIEVIGHSFLRGHDDKVIYHRDYLDVGAMLYEHIPVLGSAVRFIKNRASQ